MNRVAWAVAVLFLVAPVSAEEPASKSAFSNVVIDLGMVVSDVERSAKFYTEAIGFKELPGFDVPGEFAKDAGLTAGGALKVRVLALGEGPNTTKLKLVEVIGAKPPKSHSEVIESQTGFRYLTIYVTETNAALARLEKAGVKPIGKTPLAISGGSFLTCVKDPDGNLVELIGPKK